MPASSFFKLPYILLFVSFASATIFSSAQLNAQSLSLDPDKLDIASLHAIIYDVESDTELYSKNSDYVAPIASITKLMTAMVTLDANLPLNERISVEIKDVPEMRNVLTRIRIGSELSRQDLIRLAVMSSENRAAATLAHHYPGGVAAFLGAMNAKAKTLGMNDTYFADPTGLSEHNRSSARDLTKLVLAARDYPLIREYSTTEKKDAFFTVPQYALAFYNTNPLIEKPEWEIILSKTGYINEAGRCLVMLVELGGRELAVVLLDSFGKYTHIGDAGRIRDWVETGTSGAVPQDALNYAAIRKVEKNLDSN